MLINTQVHRFSSEKVLWPLCLEIQSASVITQPETIKDNPTSSEKTEVRNGKKYHQPEPRMDRVGF